MLDFKAGLQRQHDSKTAVRRVQQRHKLKLSLLGCAFASVTILGSMWGAVSQAHADSFATQPVRDPDYHYAQPTHRLDIRSSVQVSRETLRDAYIASRDAYTQKLQKYAKASTSDAKNAVTAAHPGMKIDTIQLRNIRTSLVYMAIVEDNEDKYLVIVDAGNGKVLLDRPLPTHHERVFASHD